MTALIGNPWARADRIESALAKGKFDFVLGGNSLYDVVFKIIVKGHIEPFICEDTLFGCHIKMGKLPR
jgi:hypothetical protein